MEHPNNLDQQIANLRTLQESYDAIAGAAEAYNTGKVQLAQAITSKGVETSPTESYPEMAEKVNAIAQETYEINGGEMYAKQLFGSLETPNYWNLYEVLTQLLSDGRLVQYGGILLAEYYKDYDSLALSGAGAGGAYVVSDKDGNGQFKMYTEDTTHVWSTEFDGKGNRWVAYCFADAGHDFEITDTNTSPRTIHIGRNVGVITSIVATRLSSVNVHDGSKLGSFVQNTYGANFGRVAVFRNLTCIKEWLFTANPNAELVYIQGDYIQLNGSTGDPIHWEGTDHIFGIGDQNLQKLNTIIISANEIKGVASLFGYNQNLAALTQIIVSGIEKCDGYLSYVGGRLDNSVFIAPNLKSIILDKCEKIYAHLTTGGNNARPTYMYISYKTNDKTKTIKVFAPSLTDIELQNGYCKPLYIVQDAGNSLTEANIYAHILQRLKQDEPDCGDGVTITLGSTNLARLTSEESVQLLDDLTNTYGYTFA